MLPGPRRTDDTWDLPAQLACALALFGLSCGELSKPPARVCSAADSGPRSTADANLFAIDLFAFVGPAADCVTCVRDHCGAAINACANDPRCRDGVACTLANCASRSLLRGQSVASIDLGCVSACFENDLQATLQVAGIAACTTGICGETCTDVIPAPAAPVDAGGEAAEYAKQGTKPAQVPSPLDAAAQDAPPSWFAPDGTGEALGGPE